MKKRILALALCLVTAVSLLPVTALAAPFVPYFSGLEDGKTYCGEVQFSVFMEDHYGRPSFVGQGVYYVKDGVRVYLTPDDEKYTLPAGIGTVPVVASYDSGLQSIHITVTVNNGHTWGAGTPVGNGKHTHSCTVDGCGASETVSCADTDRNHKCDDCGAIVHTWLFKQTDSTLTATCTPNCDIAPVRLTLKADSVTLPNSPFNARLEGWEQFKEMFPMVSYEKLVYKYHGPNGWSVVEPTAANAKAGEYQVGVRITNLPGPVVPDGPGGPVAMAENQDGVSYADLYVKYTAADPAITAQTGDNRPVELMMAGVAVFSALAAAAFVVDNKRRYQR